VHRGLLIIEGRVSSGLRLYHAGGTLYGELPSPALVETHREAFVALRHLGFGDSAAKRRLEGARVVVGTGADLPTLLRQALAQSC
jgi:hypothetical protein